jgi:hypothetical protein
MKKILRNAIKGDGDSRMSVTEFRYNFEYLDCLKELNAIYESYCGSDHLLSISSGDSSNTIIIEAEAYLLEYTGSEFDASMDKDVIESQLRKQGVEHYTAEFIADSIVTKKPIDLVNLIENQISSLSQGSSYRIDIIDREGNEGVFEINY